MVKEFSGLTTVTFARENGGAGGIGHIPEESCGAGGLGVRDGAAQKHGNTRQGKSERSKHLRHLPDVLSTFALLHHIRRKVVKSGSTCGTTRR